MAQPPLNLFNTSRKTDEEIGSFNPETADENDIIDFQNIVKSEDKEVKKVLKTLKFIYTWLKFKKPTLEEIDKVSDEEALKINNVKEEYHQIDEDKKDPKKWTAIVNKEERAIEKKKLLLDKTKRAILNTRRKKVYILYLLNELRKTDEGNLLKKKEIEYNGNINTLSYNAYDLQDLYLKEKPINDLHNLLYSGKKIIKNEEIGNGRFGNKGFELGNFSNNGKIFNWLSQNGGKKSRKNRNKSNRKNKSKKTKKANRKTTKNKRA